MNQNPLSLESFNPFAVHFFTNGSGILPPRSALPPPHSVPLPCPHLRTFNAGAISPERYTSSSDTSSVASTDSSPSSRNVTPLHSPKPRVPPVVRAPAPPRPIFETFRKDATTPDLVLKKSLPARPK